MRNVNRPNMSTSYKSKYLIPWKQELVAALNATTDGKWASLDKNIQKKFSQRWKRKPIKQTLITMYDTQCAYCECSLKVRGEVEHLWPRVVSPEKAIDWENLHWACPRCNGIKSRTDKEFNKNYPLVDPSSTEPIKEFLVYEEDDILAELTITINKNANKQNKIRAKNTINALELDDGELSSTKYNLLKMIESTWQSYINETDALKRNAAKKTLQNVFKKKNYQSVKDYAIEKHGITV